jgi:hypothetical protein
MSSKQFVHAPYARGEFFFGSFRSLRGRKFAEKFRDYPARARRHFCGVGIDTFDSRASRRKIGVSGESSNGRFNHRCS